MKRVLVQYSVKPGTGDENAKYIERVFEELKASAPEGIRYASFRLPDGVSFVHMASIETEDGSNPIATTAAFGDFQTTLKGRLEAPPTFGELDEIGNYRFFGE